MQHILTQLQNNYQLLDLKDLSPKATNNKIFSSTVSLILENQDQITDYDKIKFDGLFDNFPIAANQAEFELECSCKKFEDYPYLQNYKELVEYEIKSLNSLNKISFKNILFVGSGPLPISSHYYSQHFPRAHIVNLDKSLLAVELAKLHFPRLCYKTEDAQNLSQEYLATFDLIILAAGVGYSINNKLQIIHNILSKKSKNTTILFRDSPDLSSLLYFPVPTITSYQVYNFATTKPKTIINSCKIIL